VSDLGEQRFVDALPTQAVMDDFKAWLLAEQGRHPPRGAMGDAISRQLGRADALPHLPIDNNASEPS
jgi:transposase